MPAVRYSISLDPVNDARLVRFLAQQANVSAVVREALYAYVDKPTAVETKLDSLLEMMRNMRTVEVPAEETPAEGDEPAEARKGLDAMKKRFRKGER